MTREGKPIRYIVVCHHSLPATLPCCMYHSKPPSKQHLLSCFLSCHPYLIPDIS